MKEIIKLEKGFIMFNLDNFEYVDFDFAEFVESL